MSSYIRGRFGPAFGAPFRVSTLLHFGQSGVKKGKHYSKRQILLYSNKASRVKIGIELIIYQITENSNYGLKSIYMYLVWMLTLVS